MITQYISAIVFFGQGAIFNGILELMRQTKKGFFEYLFFYKLKPLVLRNESVFQPYLSLKFDYALFALYLTRNMLKTLRSQGMHGMNLNLHDNCHTVILGKSAVGLSSIGTIFHTLLNNIKHNINEMSLEVIP